MKYKIISGKYETGNVEQQMGYQQLFGKENIQRKFDLYFHWYNLVHEMGHCLVEKYGIQKSQVQEEMFVNEFAVSYYRFIGENEKLNELKTNLQAVIDQVPSPVPEGQTFLSFFESIWGTEQLMDVMLYGYFQLNSVLEALKKERSFADVIGELGVELQFSGENEERTINQRLPRMEKCEEPIASSSAEVFLKNAIANLKAIGLEVPEVRLELVDNPMVQCAQKEN